MKVGNINIALIGNPNVGKTSVFNQLTGLNQQVGNYPGITVEKKQGVCKLSSNLKATILDLPGTYSLNASSLDENVVIELLLNKNDKDYPEVAIVVTEVENLKRNLLLFTQIKDLEIPTILVINMSDRMSYKGISLDIPYLEDRLKTKIALVSSRKGEGIDDLKNLIVNYKNITTEPCLNASNIDVAYFDNLRHAFPNDSLYKLWLVITQDVNFANLNRNELQITSFTKSKEALKKLQQKETIKRYQFINEVLKVGQKIDLDSAKGLRSKLDKILMHKVFGYVIFFLILMLIFQSIFDWSSIPMDFIDTSFTALSSWTQSKLPAGVLTNLIVQGIIPGLGGIVIFIPQIAFLFLFISILEESGYMSRVVFLMDKSMRKFGLSGKSVVPLISGTACAIPAIMATRNIENWKERLITILVTPFTTCSARLPVYAIIISLVIPDTRLFGLFNLQGLTLMLLYLLGFSMAFFSAWILNKILKIQSKSYFVVEMPNYKLPMFKNVAINVIEKTKSFVFGAGKIILALSVILWFLASYGPGENFKNAREIVSKQKSSTKNLENDIASYKLENSYIGIIGKSIEPAIRPLGYDWKIGIAIVTSFAAREVFVGTLATIYSIEETGNQEATIKNKLSAEINPITGNKLFNLASGISLLLFYVFAMQCISTLAVTKKETNSWKWPAIQLVFMSGFAYAVALIAYQILK
ncbi:ferrous iron transport protein B [Flavobacterium psychrophilum]|uniref:Ferrous iron transport protein B n=1 Tax=Flavobacterium psychrophilum (strain ATCC 49511 / DSM 21280 / CIP 103535 / JIP02/86) TaxID=402612 RepID=A6GVT6_FLAPJ|nr:ferrous iron transport protein B [Flavobacterium psychrophilum]MCB5972127.1 ferrous iron transport protein B [Flavobacterium psychrophilum]MCB5978229.1 ferrous iron transport protein B [Flavobacterium psychrophilum]MCB6062179.1 ferrous iron transport protein B [Flavobacterium psychrophilum]MCB6063857.1 ferrous iron transport protein B [Flavobacterium psychrophilum]MCB6066993.1 ferrous iron transport protein B [Flavobacterium psychrophilum]